MRILARRALLHPKRLPGIHDTPAANRCALRATSAEPATAVDARKAVDEHAGALLPR